MDEGWDGLLSLFFLERVKEADAEFYKEHVVPLKSIDSSRYEQLVTIRQHLKQLKKKEEHVVPMKA